MYEHVARGKNVLDKPPLGYLLLHLQMESLQNIVAGEFDNCSLLGPIPQLFNQTPTLQCDAAFGIKRRRL